MTPDIPPPLPHRSCPLCGADNRCAAAMSGRHDPACWCASVVASPQALARVPAEWRDKACLCRGCLGGEPADAAAQ